MKKIVLMIIPALICGMVLTSCDSKIGDENQIDIKYPTTIHRLSEETLMQMRSDFAQRNPFFFSNVNHFGFCALVEGSYGMPVPLDEVFTEEEAIESVKEFVLRNPEYTGINNLDNLHFKSVSQAGGTGREISWVLIAKSQIINGTEIMGTGFVFHTRYRAVVGAWGRYFPNVYVPVKFNLDVEKAKSKLRGKELYWYGYAGKISLGKVTKNNLQECSANLIIVPLITEEKIELRIAWQIIFDAGGYPFYVDVMTGEIIQEE